MYSLDEAKKVLSSDGLFMVAGDENLLKQLPNGNWIGGTIPYFIGQDGGVTTKDFVQVTELDSRLSLKKLAKYDESNLDQVTKDYPKNGSSFIVIPAFSKPHIHFAQHALNFDGLFNSPLVGWIAGFDLNQEGASAKVVNGLTGDILDQNALVLHCELESRYTGQIEIINPFSIDDSGPKIEFPEISIQPSACLIDGKEANLAEYMAENNYNVQLPLITDFSGANINVCIQEINTDDKHVKLFGPVFPGTEYRLSKPMENYQKDFLNLVPKDIEATWSCNCVLNYLYSELEGKKMGDLQGPATFGEIAYILLNQTAVYLDIKDKIKS